MVLNEFVVLSVNVSGILVASLQVQNSFYYCTRVWCVVLHLVVNETRTSNVIGPIRDKLSFFCFQMVLFSRLSLHCQTRFIFPGCLNLSFAKFSEWNEVCDKYNIFHFMNKLLPCKRFCLKLFSRWRTNVTLKAG